MRTKFKLPSALAVLFGWVSLALAAEPLDFVGSDTFETTIVQNRPGCPTATSISTDDIGSGHASLLGRYTFVAGECIDLATLEITLGFFTVTAADGSKITGNYSGAAQYTDSAKTSILYAVSGFVSGGTGRFKNVTTGSATFLGGASFTSPTTATGFDTIFAGDLYAAK